MLFTYFPSDDNLPRVGKVEYESSNTVRLYFSQSEYPVTRKIKFPENVLKIMVWISEIYIITESNIYMIDMNKHNFDQKLPNVSSGNPGYKLPKLVLEIISMPHSLKHLDFVCAFKSIVYAQVDSVLYRFNFINMTTNEQIFNYRLIDILHNNFIFKSGGSYYISDQFMNMFTNIGNQRPIVSPDRDRLIIGHSSYQIHNNVLVPLFKFTSNPEKWYTNNSVVLGKEVINIKTRQKLDLEYFNPVDSLGDYVLFGDGIIRHSGYHDCKHYKFNENNIIDYLILSQTNPELRYRYLVKEDNHSLRKIVLANATTFIDTLNIHFYQVPLNICQADPNNQYTYIVIKSKDTSADRLINFETGPSEIANMKKIIIDYQLIYGIVETSGDENIYKAILSNRFVSAFWSLVDKLEAQELFTMKYEKKEYLKNKLEDSFSDLINEEDPISKVSKFLDLTTNCLLFLTLKEIIMGESRVIIYTEKKMATYVLDMNPEYLKIMDTKATSVIGNYEPYDLPINIPDFYQRVNSQ